DYSVFFQAEDGIRDWSVTGVQTCALPISRGGKEARGRTEARPAARCRLLPHRPGLRCRETANAPVPASRTRRRGMPDAPCRENRSEERRVGKEGRSRWSQIHQEVR